jgi:hypothetical protein
MTRRLSTLPLLVLACAAMVALMVLAAVGTVPEKADAAGRFKKVI